MQKLVIVINGRGGVGKDTLVDSLYGFHTLRKTSSIDSIKRIALEGGWNGLKDEKSRKFLADLKDLFTNYNDLPLRSILDDLEAFCIRKTELLFVFIREPEEIRRFCESAELVFERFPGQDVKITTLLVKRDAESAPLGNSADDNVEDFGYEHVFHNDGPLEHEKERFRRFIEQVFEAS